MGHLISEMVTLIQGFLVTSGEKIAAGSSRGYESLRNWWSFSNQIQIIPPLALLGEGSLPHRNGVVPIPCTELGRGQTQLWLRSPMPLEVSVLILIRELALFLKHTVAQPDQ